MQAPPYGRTRVSRCHWYAPGNRTPGEWGMIQVGFVVVVAFHLLLFARYFIRTQTAAPGITSRS